MEYWQNNHDYTQTSNLRFPWKCAQYKSDYCYYISRVIDDVKCIAVTAVCVCVRVSVCLSLAAFPHYCTDPDVTWGNGSGVPSSCALIGRIGAQVLLLWQHSAECEISASACTRCMPGYYFGHTCTKPQLVKTQMCNCAAKQTQLNSCTTTEIL